MSAKHPLLYQWKLFILTIRDILSGLTVQNADGFISRRMISMTTRKEEYEKFEEVSAVEEEVIEDFNNGLLSKEERDKRIMDMGRKIKDKIRHRYSYQRKKEENQNGNI